MTEAELQQYEQLATGLRMREDFRGAAALDELVAEVRRLQAALADVGEAREG